MTPNPFLRRYAELLDLVRYTRDREPTPKDRKLVFEYVISEVG